MDAREVLIRGHDIVSKIQNSAFVNYGVVRVAKKQDSRGAKFDAIGGLGWFVMVILEKTLFKQFLVDAAGIITENWVNVKALLERKDKHSNMSWKTKYICTYVLGVYLVDTTSVFQAMGQIILTT